MKDLGIYLFHDDNGMAGLCVCMSKKDKELF